MKLCRPPTEGDIARPASSLTPERELREVREVREGAGLMLGPALTLSRRLLPSLMELREGRPWASGCCCR